MPLTKKIFIDIYDLLEVASKAHNMKMMEPERKFSNFISISPASETTLSFELVLHDISSTEPGEDLGIKEIFD